MKKYILAALLLPIITCASEIEKYKILRITPTSLQQAIVKEKNDEEYRFQQKVALIGASVIATCAIIQFYGHFAPKGELLKANFKYPETNPPVAESKDVSMMYSALWGVAKIPYDTGSSVCRFIASTIPSFFGMWALNSGSSYFSKSFSYFNEMNDLSGFIKHKTKIWNYCLITRKFAVPFDIYSYQLTNENNLLALMKRDFLYRTKDFSELEECVVHAAQRRQAIDAGFINEISQVDAFNRESLVEYCNLLVLDVEKIVAFIECKIEEQGVNSYCSSCVARIIQDTNKMMQLVEEKLSTLSIDQMYEQSKQGQGLFDFILNYTLGLKTQIDSVSLRLQDFN